SRHTSSKRGWSSDVCSSDLSESESISGNVRWGLRKAYENGTIQIGPNLYGFRREKDGPVLIDEEKAAVIRQIAQWFLDGDSLHRSEERRVGIGWSTQIEPTC